MSLIDGVAPEVTDDDDADDAKGVMIALLPTTSEWCKIDLPHLTLVYAGTTDTLSIADFNDLAKDASMIAVLSAPLYLRVTGLAVFGDDTEKVNVITLQPTPELLALRRALDEWNVSKYPFNPHCTIGPVEDGIQDTILPRGIGFNRVYASYGTESMVFNMANSVPSGLY